MLQIWNLELEPCITIQGLSVEFHSVCSIQQSGILPIRDVGIVCMSMYDSSVFCSLGSGGRLKRSIETLLRERVSI